MNQFLSYFAPLYGFLEVEYDMYDKQVLNIHIYQSLQKLYSYSPGTRKWYINLSNRRISDNMGGPDFLLEDFLVMMGSTPTGLNSITLDLYGEPHTAQLKQNNPKCDCGGRKTYNESESGPHFKVNHSVWCELVKRHMVE